MIPYGRQSISAKDIDAVVAVLKSDYLTQGPVVPLFEQAVAELVGSQYGVAVNSATSALHIACQALDLGKGDWLWTSPNTFVASANCALYCNANVDFVDIDPKTYNLCPDKLEKKLVQAEINGKLPKIIVPVHFAGQSCDMERIYKLSQIYGFKIIEDASHAIGGRYKNEPIGNCKYSDITVFSFHPVKIITTGEGGLATTNSQLLAKKLMQLRSHGITRDASEMVLPFDGSWSYEQQSLGFNYRMTDIQAALGVSQLNSLNNFIERRHELAARYKTLLLSLPAESPYQEENTYSAYHLYPILINFKELRKRKSEVFDNLRNLGVGVNVHYIPVHTQPYYQNLGFNLGDFPEAEDYYKKTITIPLFPSMTETQQDYVVSQLSKVLI